MTSDNEPTEQLPEIVDLDNCPKRKSILIGAAVTFAMSFIIYSWLIVFANLILGGMAAVGYYTKTYGISVRWPVGVKMGLISVLLGVTVYFPLSQPVQTLFSLSGRDLSEDKSNMIQQLYEDGNPDMAKLADAYFPERIEGSDLPIILGFWYFMVVFLALIFGTIGGLIGSAIFKKGPLAQ